MLKFVSPGVLREHKTEIPRIVQQIYMQHQIAAEAVQLHLDRQEPWRTELARTHRIMTQGVTNYPGDPNVPPAVQAAWNDAREKLLRKAYLSQAVTPEGKKALLEKERAKYKIQVQDSEFFVGTGI